MGPRRRAPVAELAARCALAALLWACAACGRAQALAGAPGTGSGGGAHAPRPAAAANIHTVFLTDCSLYSDWQTLAMVYGWRESGQAGPLTRVACCSDAERAAYDPALLPLVTTHFAPSYTTHPVTGDHYPAYNKPAGVIHWLDRVTPAEEWLVVLDSDMILRRPFDPAELNLTRGWATGARYDYLIGVDNELAEHHIPRAPRIMDDLAGPRGRRADRVGGFYVAHRDDLKRIAPLWLKYAEDVRADPEVWVGAGRFLGLGRRGRGVRVGERWTSGWTGGGWGRGGVWQGGGGMQCPGSQHAVRLLHGARRSCVRRTAQACMRAAYPVTSPLPPPHPTTPAPGVAPVWRHLRQRQAGGEALDQ